MHSITGTQSVQRAIHLFKHIGEHAEDGMTLTELVRDTGIPRSTAHRLLQLLKAEGLLVFHQQSKRYQVGPFVHTLGLMSAEYRQLQRSSASILEQLAADSGDTSFLFLRQENDAVCIGRHEGTFKIDRSVLPLGSRQSLGVSAGGLAILAFLPEHERLPTLDAITPRLYRYGQLTRNELERLIHQTQLMGMSWIANRAMPEIAGIGIPIYTQEHHVVGAITLATTSQRMTYQHVHTLKPLLQQAAHTLSALFD